MDDSAQPSKALPIALAAVLLTLGAFAIWSAVNSAGRARDTVSSAQLGSAHAHLRDAMAGEVAAVYGRQGKAPAEVRAAIAEKRALFEKSSRIVRAKGGREDLAALAAATAVHTGLLKGLDAVLAMPAGPAAERRLKEAAAALAPVGERLHELAHLNHDSHVDDMAELGAVQHRLLFVTLIAFPLGFLLTGVLFVALRRGERAQRRAEVARLEAAARIDHLTGLTNRREFEEELARAHDGSERLSVVLLDLDGLKRANDRVGHDAGDARLVALAEAMRAAAGDRGSCHRIGGDEFAIILPEVTEWGAVEVARATIDHLAAREFDPRASVSAGVTERHPGEAADDLVHRADLALLEAKRARRHLVVWSPILQPEAIESGFDPHDHHTKALAAGLVRAVDAKDPFTHTHCETVAAMCELVATDLGLDRERAARVHLAGLLHDVGKIGVPDAILGKPGKLTDDEYATIKEHARLGAEIVAAAGLLQEAEWVGRHHERPDGRGYPDGLAGEEIPLEARIIGAADALEAMTAGRPYARRMTLGEALAELQRCAGTQFDPEVVTSLHRVLRAPVLEPVA
jgi:diguanylate cyclase (GGDEF)-like protein/putative nucleotidyltransferase with HDIG domain